MAVQWNEFFIFLLRSFARFKTDLSHQFKNIWLAAFFFLRLSSKLSTRWMDIQGYYFPDDEKLPILLGPVYREGGEPKQQEG